MSTLISNEDPRRSAAALHIARIQEDLGFDEDGLPTVAQVMHLSAESYRRAGPNPVVARVTFGVCDFTFGSCFGVNIAVPRTLLDPEVIPVTYTVAGDEDEWAVPPPANPTIRDEDGWRRPGRVRELSLRSQAPEQGFHGGGGDPIPTNRNGVRWWIMTIMAMFASTVIMDIAHTWRTGVQGDPRVVGVVFGLVAMIISLTPIWLPQLYGATRYLPRALIGLSTLWLAISGVLGLIRIGVLPTWTPWAIAVAGICALIAAGRWLWRRVPVFWIGGGGP